MAKPPRYIQSSDFHDFFKAVGVGEEQPCPRCKEPRQFGWSNDPLIIGDFEWMAPDLGEEADPAKHNFFQSCDRCGFVEVYFLKKFYEWFDKR
jgi:hypothetical protein